MGWSAEQTQGLRIVACPYPGEMFYTSAATCTQANTASCDSTWMHCVQRTNAAGKLVEGCLATVAC